MLVAIRSGEAKMQPRWHFVLRTILFIVGGIIALLALLYIASFIVFGASRNRIVVRAGLRRRRMVLVLPISSVDTCRFIVVFVLILALLVKRYSFVYERLTMYLLIGIVALVALGGFLIAATPFHRTLFHSAQAAHSLYLWDCIAAFGMQRFGNIIVTIVATTTGGFIIQDHGDTPYGAVRLVDIQNRASAMMS